MAWQNNAKMLRNDGEMKGDLCSWGSSPSAEMPEHCFVMLSRAAIACQKTIS